MYSRTVGFSNVNSEILHQLAFTVSPLAALAGVFVTFSHSPFVTTDFGVPLDINVFSYYQPSVDAFCDLFLAPIAADLCPDTIDCEASSEQHRLEQFYRWERDQIDKFSEMAAQARRLAPQANSYQVIIPFCHPYGPYNLAKAIRVAVEMNSPLLAAFKVTTVLTREHREFLTVFTLW